MYESVDVNRIARRRIGVPLHPALGEAAGADAVGYGVVDLPHQGAAIWSTPSMT